MAEIEITLPTVQYGNVKVRATPEELGVDVSSPAAVGTATAVYLNLFTQGFKVGASMDVTASPTEGLKAPLAAEQEDPGVTAQAMLDEGLGGVTELHVGDDFSKSEEQIAAEDGKAPWESKVDAKPKPWETGDKPVESVKELIDPTW